MHLIGDPVNSMWSMLTRQEVSRRIYRCVLSFGIEESNFIAPILAVYEEIGWQNALKHFINVYEGRKRARLQNASPTDMQPDFLVVDTTRLPPETRRGIHRSIQNSVPAIYVDTPDRPGTGDSSFTIYEKWFKIFEGNFPFRSFFNQIEFSSALSVE